MRPQPCQRSTGGPGPASRRAIFALAPTLLLLATGARSDAAPAQSPCSLASCKRCAADGINCLECSPSYGIKDGLCLPCASPDCDDCGADPAVCRKCRPLMMTLEPGGIWTYPAYTTEKGTCEHCGPGASACADGSGVPATACEDLYGLIDGACQLCLLPDGSEPELDESTYDPVYDLPYMYPDMCRRCDGDRSRCTACQGGYVLEGGKCLKCRRKGCAECTGTGSRVRCLACEAGLGLDIATGGCMPCQLLDCYDCSRDASSCDSCAKWPAACKNFTTGACTPCADPLCEFCPAHPRLCVSCGMLITGRGLNPVTAQCEPCQVDGCAACETDTRACISCQEGFRLAAGGKECVACEMEGCASCFLGDSGVESCTACAAEKGYVGMCEEAFQLPQGLRSVLCVLRGDWLAPAQAPARAPAASPTPVAVPSPSL